MNSTLQAVCSLAMLVFVGAAMVAFVRKRILRAVGTIVMGLIVATVPAATSAISKWEPPEMLAIVAAASAPVIVPVLLFFVVVSALRR